MSTTLSERPPLPLLTIAEAARLLGVKPYPLLQLCEAGELPCGRIGARLVIPADAIREYARTVVERGYIASAAEEPLKLVTRVRAAAAGAAVAAKPGSLTRRAYRLGYDRGWREAGR